MAAGKGVYICENKGMAHQAILEVFGGKFGLAKEILIEEFLDGEEMSYFIICDGKTVLDMDLLLLNAILSRKVCLKANQKPAPESSHKGVDTRPGFR